MEKKNEKLESHTQQIYEIMLAAQASFKIVDYLTRVPEGIERDVIQQSLFFRYSIESHWKIYVIELSKLFADRKGDRFNLHAFIAKFEKGMEFCCSEIDGYSITIWKGNLQLEKNNIANLLLQRDKKYSHTDKDHEAATNTLTFQQAEELLSVVKRIVSEIFIAVFGMTKHLDLIIEPVEDLKKQLAILVDKRKQMINDLIAHGKELGIDPKDLDLPAYYR